MPSSTTVSPRLNRLPRVRISSPDGSPLTFDVDSLRVRVSDPAITLVDLAAHAWTRGDSLAFTAHRAALPHSRMSGGGVITWPRGPVLYDFTLNADPLDLTDLYWVSPDFPALRGKALVTARSRSDQLTAYTLQGLELSGAAGRIAGDVTALTDRRRGLGVEGMTLDLTDLNLDVPRPYLDTVPLFGTLTGRIAGAGFKDGIDIVMDLVFRDDSVPGKPLSSLAGGGHLVLGGPEGTLFDTLELVQGDLDLGTVRRLAPAVELQGRVQPSSTPASSTDSATEIQRWQAIEKAHQRTLTLEMHATPIATPSSISVLLIFRRT